MIKFLERLFRRKVTEIESKLQAAPAPVAGCVCKNPDASVAWKMGRTAHVSLIDESHLGAQLFRCAACNQDFLQIFTEVVDWEDGDDSQAWSVHPIEAELAERLKAAREEVDEAFLAGLGIEGRQLSSCYPRGSFKSVKWSDGPLVILPHD